jgi:hypothetical protein
MTEPIPPVIVIGMHRSGTTLLSRVLQQCGLFMGNRQDAHGEAFFFLRLNEWFLSQAHCAWDNVSQFEALDPFTRQQLARVARRHLRGIRRIGYLGTGKFFRYPNIASLDIPWGWKDPRNTVTIDIWKELFPNARIIHVSRHPVDVAQSLRKREQQTQRMIFGRHKRLHNALYFKTKLKWEEFRLSSDGWYSYMPATPSLYPRSVSRLHQGFRVWKDYVSRALDLDGAYPEQVLHIRFEDFLDQPSQGIRQICDFAGLSLDSRTEEEILGTLNPGRKFAFSNDPELVDFYRSIQSEPLLQKTGYHTTGAS